MKIISQDYLAKKIPFEFKFLHNSDLSDQQITTLAQMINEVYRHAEQGLFKEGALIRTSKAELDDMLLQKQLMVLKIDNQIMGCAHVSRNDNYLKLGMITVDANLKGKGFGKIIMENIETYAKKIGISKLQLELLTPQNWVQEHKKFLGDWYKRLGFRPIKTIPFDREELLATECNFTVYEKTFPAAS